MRPKCGRLIAFRSNGVENLHGVLGIKNGTRYALPLWFTLSSDKEEDGRSAAVRKLLSLKEKLLLSNKKPISGSHSTVHVKNEPISGSHSTVHVKNEL